MSTGFVTHSDYLRHDTGYGHPERAQRLRAVYAEIGRHEALSQLHLIDPREATEAEVARVHQQSYIDEVRRTAERGGGALDVDTPMCHESYRIALLSAGAALTAVENVIAGKHERIYVASRPPGHHARPDRGMGFCLFNNVAIAARHARTLGLERIAIVDYDVHHGNGTQDAFYSDGNVFFCSLHQSPWYPFTGDAGETGTGAGEGTNLNLPLRAGRRTHEYLAVVSEVVIPALIDFAPDLLLVSSGYDIDERDPLGEMRLNPLGFYDLTGLLLDVAESCCGGKLVVCLEGGYDLDALGQGVAFQLHAMLGSPPPDLDGAAK